MTLNDPLYREYDEINGNFPDDIGMKLLRGFGRFCLWCLRTCFWTFLLIVMVLTGLCRRQGRRRRYF